MNGVLQRIPYSASSQRTKKGNGSPLRLITSIGMQQYHHAAYMLLRIVEVVVKVSL
jgi:hypothetical protein